MHSTQAGTGPATAAPRRILLADLRSTLRKRGVPAPLGGMRFAAMTGRPSVLAGCCNELKPEPASAVSPALVPMFAGYVLLAARRLRRTHGSREVQRTFGRGVRSLERDSWYMHTEAAQ